MWPHRGLQMQDLGWVHSLENVGSCYCGDGTGRDPPWGGEGRGRLGAWLKLVPREPDGGTAPSLRISQS